MGHGIPEKLYRQILRLIPIACVDLLISDQAQRVLLIKRKNEPAKGQWWFPGGRIYFGETREVAAIRKLKDECGLKAGSIKEIGTFDVILKVPGASLPHHAVTTLFHLKVSSMNGLKIDDTSLAAQCHTVSGWRKKRLHPFVRQGLSYCKMAERRKDQ